MTTASPNAPRTLRHLLRSQAGEAQYAYLAVIGLVAAAGMAGMGSLGNAFQRAIGTQADGNAPSGRVALAVSSQAGIGEVLAKVTRQVGGVGDEARALVEVAHPLLVEPEWHMAVGLRKPPLSVLVDGASGSGKTLLLEQVADAMGARLIRAKALQLVDRSTPDATAERINALFSGAKGGKPAIVVIDDLEEIQKAAETNFPTYFFFDPLRKAIADLSAADGVLAVGTTKDVGILRHLAPELAERGTFHRSISLAKPHAPELVDMLKVHTRGMKLDKEVSLKKIADTLAGHGAVGRDVEWIVREAGLSAERRLRAAVAAKEVRRPTRLVERTRKVATPVAPTVSSWDNAGEVADVLEWWTNTYAFPAEADAQHRAMVATLRNSLTAEPGAAPAVDIGSIQRGLEFYAGAVEAGTLEPKAAIAARERSRAAFRARVAATKSTFRLTAADFDGALQTFVKEKTGLASGQYL